MLKPTYSLTIGALSSATDNAVAGPRRIEVARDMDVAADSLRIFLMARADIGLDDEVELQLGHDGENEAVFAGSVVALEPTFAGVQVTALGKMQRLLRLHTAAWYDDQSAGAIARDLIDQAGLEAGTVDEGPTLPRFAVDRRQNGFAHLKQLADRLGFELYAKRAGTICFQGLGDAAGLDAAGSLLGAATGASRVCSAGAAKAINSDNTCCRVVRAGAHRRGAASW